MKELEKRKLAAEADILEQEALSKKLQNLEKIRQLRLSNVESYAEPLATASKNLDIQASAATIIDITEVLKAQQEEEKPQ